MLSKSGKMSSHPAVRFQQIPVVEGKLSSFDKIRGTIVDDVVSETMRELTGADFDLVLGQALYSERFRLKHFKGNIYTRSRSKKDRALWNRVQAGLLRPSAEVDREQLLSGVVRHFGEEIAGHFDPRVYRFASHAVPWGVSWLLNAASVRRFLPWGMTESLASRLHILGEVTALQRLAERGTILLVPTHQSNIDSILIGYVIYLLSLPPFAYGAGINLYSNPILNFFMSHLGAYTVDRQKSNEIYKTALKNYSTRLLREGVHSIFFPGGGRSRSGAVESKLKLGLLGTGLQAQIQGYLSGAKFPNVYVVPMVMSYHFVLEAGSLIEDYLADAGKHRYIMMDDESWQPVKVLRFFWKLFSAQTAITVRIGKPLDIFGNFVDEEGRSIGPNGRTVDPRLWLSTKGELRSDPQRDREYTRELGNRLVDRFHRENTVLTSHVVAFAFFEGLRRRYPDLDVFRFLRLSISQRSLPYDEFTQAAAQLRERLVMSETRGELHLSPELKTPDTEKWIRDGIGQLGCLHGAGVIRESDGVVWTEDMNLLYYYRNRLSGYGLSLLAESEGPNRMPGENDSKRFLA
ncbi:MAG: hypothetical protein A2428_17000 [Bdellovibrionales bacterium RIFOXYC1_FULL_54_43]|nr:MAG: hypothetical protein A2428_17000 [Bdellovibrionales bacterium RIFOXYC1_FULL_54_43]OFZ84997.1 MAG: hypothetical protein A2603_04235 [Bdellovibrionales bacterium RIFOXYD1_FULL_55_31]